MPSKQPPEQSHIPGLKLVDPETLPHELHRFRQDDLYFISHCEYDDTDLSSATQQKGFIKSESHFNRRMDRACRWDALREAIMQQVHRRKLLSSENLTHIVLKIAKEPDCHFTIVESDTATHFYQVLQRIMAHRKHPDNVMNFKELSSSEDIENFISMERPKGYLTPQQITKLNKERRRVQDEIESISSEALRIKNDIEDLAPDVETKREELQMLESKLNEGDISALRSEHDKYRVMYASLRKTFTTDEISLTQLVQDNTRLQEQLDEERANHESLVASGVSSALSSDAREQNEMKGLREKSHRRETERLVAELSSLNKSLQQRPAYTGHTELVLRAIQLEEDVEDIVIHWDNEMGETNKMEKYLERTAMEVDHLNHRIKKLHGEKMSLLDEIAPPPPPQTENPNSSSGAAEEAQPASSSDRPKAGGQVEEDLLGGASQPQAAKPLEADDIL